MRNFVVNFETVITFIVSVLLIFPADVAGEMLKPQMDSEGIVVEKILLTKPAVGMHEDDVPVLVDISPFQMPGELSLGVEFLLFEDTGFFLKANIAKASLMVLLQMLLEEGDVGELLVVLAWLAVEFDEAFVLRQLLEFFLGILSGVEDVRVEFIREDFLGKLSEVFKQVRNDDLLGFGLG